MNHRYKVIGACEIDGVPPGGEVVLDPEKVNIGVLLKAGHVELVPPRPKAKEPNDG